MTFLRSVFSVLFIFVFIQQPAFSAKPDRNGGGGGKKDTSDSNEICDQYGNLKGWAKKNHTQDECTTSQLPPPNTHPTVVITSPDYGYSAEYGTSINFAATAVDNEDGDLSQNVSWVSSIDGSISSAAILSEGTHTITASVVDAGGLMATDAIAVSIMTPIPVNTVPTVSISSPSAGTYELGTSLVLVGSASDNEDGDLTDKMVWTSSIDGIITGPVTLSEGVHTISVSVSDSGGLVATADTAVTIVAPNEAPALTITAPVDGATVEEGNAFVFVATATDTEDGDLSQNVSWVSSIDGAISSSVVLSTGNHTITARVSDREGLAVTDTISVTVTEAASVNTAPTVVITSPETGATAEEDYSFLFEAVANDNEDGDLSNSVTWTSSIDGQIANLTTLSVGDHVITATVADSGGLIAEDSLEVSVTALDVTTKSVQVNWSTPLYRDDGSALAMEEIAGFEITLVAASTGETLTIDVPDGYATSLVTEPVALDEYTLTMRTYDVSGSYSGYTNPVIVIVDNL